MKRILSAVMMLAACAVSAGCEDNDEELTSQRDSIVSFLTSSHVPVLVSEDDIESSLEPEPQYYEVIDFCVYRYISTLYDEGRDARAVVEQGDEAEITYTAYEFSGSMPRTETVYMTNDASVIADLVEDGLNPEYWSSEPLTVKLGETNIIKGVALSLEGCREGDTVEAYMTFDAAYGDDVMGVVPHESAVVWIYTINKVTKH